MHIYDATRGCHGAPHLMAVRPSGRFFRISERGVLMTGNKVGGETRFVACIADLVAIDWEVMATDKFIEMVEKRAAAPTAVASVNGDN